MADANTERTLIQGYEAGDAVSPVDRDYATIIGPRAAAKAANSGRLTAIGFEAGVEAIGSRCSVFLGTAAGAHAPYSWGMTCAGYAAGRFAEWSEQSFFGGVDAARMAKRAPLCVFLGARAGRDALDVSNAVVIGADVTRVRDCQTIIGNDLTQQTVLRGRLKLPNTKPPAHCDSPGEPGELALDDNWLYACVAPNQWKRMRLKVDEW